jgi:hypothetical protein|tara:strand:- start:1262 stop:1588 length:327 start_codon:yes stop_codon:yes gene_type:complete
MFFNVMGFSCIDAHLSTAFVFILPKHLDIYCRLYYNVWIVRRLYLKGLTNDWGRIYFNNNDVGTNFNWRTVYGLCFRMLLVYKPMFNSISIMCLGFLLMLLHGVSYYV